MRIAGVVVMFAGYTALWWGWERLQGCGVGLMDLVVPGRWHGSASGAYPGFGCSSGAGASSTSSSGAGGGLLSKGSKRIVTPPGYPPLKPVPYKAG